MRVSLHNVNGNVRTGNGTLSVRPDNPLFCFYNDDGNSVLMFRPIKTSYCYNLRRWTVTTIKGVYKLIELDA